MNVAKNGIRVIKREEREQQAQQKIETPGRETHADPETHRAQEERELASSVTEWVNDSLRRQHDVVREDMGQLRAFIDS